MALPKLLREIFENDGAGPKFRADKIPVTQVTVDSALSSTSENPVQNKVVKAAIDANTSKVTNLQASIDSAYTKYVAEIG